MPLFIYKTDRGKNCEGGEARVPAAFIGEYTWARVNPHEILTFTTTPHNKESGGRQDTAGTPTPRVILAGDWSQGGDSQVGEKGMKILYLPSVGERYSRGSRSLNWVQGEGEERVAGVGSGVRTRHKGGFEN